MNIIISSCMRLLHMAAHLLMMGSIFWPVALAGVVC